MKPYTYVLFDWDGCLAKTLDLWLAAYKEAFSAYGISLDDRTITHEVFGDWEAPRKFGIQNLEAYIDKLLAALNRNYQKLRLYTNAYEVLDALKKRGKKLALITSSKRESVSPVLDLLKLAPFFESFLAAQDVAKHKPDPEVIDKTLASLKAGKNESVLVGDTQSDVEGARNAGIDSVLFYPAEHKTFYDREVLLASRPTHVIDDLKQLLELV